VSGEPVHSDRLDAVASSPSWPNPRNNEGSCSKRKSISEQWVVPQALPYADQTRYLLCCPQPACSKARTIPPHDPQVLLSSTLTCSIEWSCSCRCRRSKTRHSDTFILECSNANIKTEEKGNPSSVTTLIVQTSYLPSAEPTTHSRMCTNLSYGLQTAVSWTHLVKGGWSLPRPHAGQSITRLYNAYMRYNWD
jgi:hypothetical protein